MNIEITGETEKLIRAAIATGQYASAEEFIAAMARQQPELRSRCSEVSITSSEWQANITASQSAPVTGESGDSGTDAADYPGRWEDECLLDEALKSRGTILSLSQIHAAMQGVRGKLSDDIAQERDDR